MAFKLPCIHVLYLKLVANLKSLLQLIRRTNTAQGFVWLSIVSKIEIILNYTHNFDTCRVAENNPILAFFIMVVRKYFPCLYSFLNAHIRFLFSGKAMKL